MNDHDTSDNHQLGSLLRVHKTSVWNYWWAIAISGLILLIMVILASAGARNARHADLIVVYAIFGALAAIPILGIIYQIKNEARFYEEGIVYENRRYIKTVRWAEICDVWEMCVRADAEGVPLPSQTFYGVRTVDGITIRFSPRLNDIKELGHLLKSEAARWGVPVRGGVPPAKRNLMSFLWKKT